MPGQHSSTIFLKHRDRGRRGKLFFCQNYFLRRSAPLFSLARGALWETGAFAQPRGKKKVVQLPTSFQFNRDFGPKYSKSSALQGCSQMEYKIGKKIFQNLGKNVKQGERNLRGGRKKISFFGPKTSLPWYASERTVFVPFCQINRGTISTRQK